MTMFIGFLDISRRSLRACTGVLIASMWILHPFASCFAATPAGMRKDVVFQEYSPLAANAELIERLFRPMLARGMREKLAASGQGMDGQSVDLAREHFALYVPASSPMVFASIGFG